MLVLLVALDKEEREACQVPLDHLESQENRDLLV